MTAREASKMDEGGHGCINKARRIRERLHLKVGHEVITEMCSLWGCRDENDFWRVMNEMSDVQLFEAVMEAISRVRKRKPKGGKREVVPAYA